MMSSDLEEMDSHSGSVSESGQPQGESWTGSSGGSINSAPTLGTNGDSKSTPAPLAARETKAVTWSKLLVLCVLLLAAGGAAAATYLYTRQQQDDEFRTRFRETASQIISVYQINAAKIFDSYDAFALQITSYAIGSGSQWPFVTMPQFEAQTDKLIKQTGAKSMGYACLVKPDQLEAYNNFSVAEQGWRQEGMEFQNMGDAPLAPIVPFIYSSFRPPPRPDTKPREGQSDFLPLRMVAPIQGNQRISNFDSFGLPTIPKPYARMLELQAPVLTQVRNLDENDTLPESVLLAPIFRTAKGGDVTGVIISLLPWINYFKNLLTASVGGVLLVIHNNCNQTQSYLIDGPSVEYLGPEDLHDTEFEDLKSSTAFTPFSNELECLHTLDFYPTDDFRDQYFDDTPIIFTVGAISIFIITTLVFVLYDCLVERRQNKVLTSAERSNAIVTSLFPSNVRDRLMDDYATSSAKPEKTKMGFGGDRLASQHETTNEMLDPFSLDRPSQVDSSLPIADLFLNTSVLFADISGFTAWSSTREPTQVFALLEAIYNSFDRIARRRRVFKVETIGDCYVAATGLPDPMANHAIVMARFARDCLSKMASVVKELEISLGPDTAELCMRIGIHSGSVTAGVLRGEKSRFQLFGDTVNTAARMESTGIRNRIQVSQQTADLIVEGSCRDLWVEPRETKAQVKGKGELQTYWLCYSRSNTSASVTSASLATLEHPRSPSQQNHGSSGLETSAKQARTVSRSSGASSELVLDSSDADVDRRERLVNWNRDVLQMLLKRVVAMRGGKVRLYRQSQQFAATPTGATVLDEVQEIIDLPNKASGYKVDPSTVVLPTDAIEQLHDYITCISQMYNSNCFHSFDHASHVTQSVTKLLSRVVTPDSIGPSKDQGKSMKLHNYTYGIASEPLTQFAVAFSALIHDVDHPGVPNAQLVREGTDQAQKYSNKSIAEQHSVDIAWDMLMQQKYRALRACIYSNQAELSRFRQLVVNTVMATDIADRELGQLRRNRWERAFATRDSSVEDDATAKDSMNRKATIVIEHLIQASDVAHTMQHWHVYLKWNERFFWESYQAFREGRTERRKAEEGATAEGDQQDDSDEAREVFTDPSTGWYQGELNFFDFYIIPLAKKLQDCGVFGVGADEYLNYAKTNRNEWEKKGKAIVEVYLENYNQNKIGEESGSSR